MEGITLAGTRSSVEVLQRTPLPVHENVACFLCLLLREQWMEMSKCHLFWLEGAADAWLSSSLPWALETNWFLQALFLNKRATNPCSKAVIKGVPLKGDVHLIHLLSAPEWLYKILAALNDLITPAPIACSRTEPAQLWALWEVRSGGSTAMPWVCRCCTGHGEEGAAFSLYNCKRYAVASPGHLWFRREHISDYHIAAFSPLQSCSFWAEHRPFLAWKG